jgi:pantoate--beta-alanine ligase
MARPTVVAEPAEIRQRITALRASGQAVGLVPTMGNLHAGHASLLRRAKAECHTVAATIFVNPLQFNDPEDLRKYPRTPDEDLAICAAEGTDLVFMPTPEAMYRPQATTIVQVRGLEDPLCGQQRPGHFVGVATVVAKLFHLLPAQVAYFGEKDFQQLALIRRMVADLDFDIAIRSCPTVRDADGLALSSRNRRLAPEDRAEAPLLHQALLAVQALAESGEHEVATLRQEFDRAMGKLRRGKVEYAEIVDADTLAPVVRLERPARAAVAVAYPGARLIDNVGLLPRKGSS